MCPPLEGPGVPPERVDAVSSWSLFQEGCGARRKGNKVRLGCSALLVQRYLRGAGKFSSPVISSFKVAESWLFGYNNILWNTFTI